MIFTDKLNAAMARQLLLGAVLGSLLFLIPVRLIDAGFVVYQNYQDSDGVESGYADVEKSELLPVGRLMIISVCAVLVLLILNMRLAITFAGVFNWLMICLFVLTAASDYRILYPSWRLMRDLFFGYMSLYMLAHFIVHSCIALLTKAGRKIYTPAGPVCFVLLVFAITFSYPVCALIRTLFVTLSAKIPFALPW